MRSRNNAVATPAPGGSAPLPRTHCARGPAKRHTSDTRVHFFAVHTVNRQMNTAQIVSPARRALLAHALRDSPIRARALLARHPSALRVHTRTDSDAQRQHQAGSQLRHKRVPPPSSCTSLGSPARDLSRSRPTSMHTAGHHHPGGQELHSSISKPPWLTAAPPAAHSQACAPRVGSHA